MTAVEWVLFELSKNGLLPDGIPSDIYNKAKEIEKEEKVKFSLKVYLEKRQTHGGDIMQIAEKLVNL